MIRETMIGLLWWICDPFGWLRNPQQEVRAMAATDYKYGFLTAGGVPGDLEEAFWRGRSHYVYAEVTVPQSKGKILALKDWIADGAIVAAYFDCHYCGTREEATSSFRRSILPPMNHPCFVRDTAGEIIQRWGTRGLFIPAPNSNTQRTMAAGLATLTRDLDIHARFDNHAPTIGWDFTSRQGVRHSEIVWNNITFRRTADGLDFVSDDWRSINAIYKAGVESWATILRGYMPDRVLIPSSGEKWLGEIAKKWRGRLQERGIGPGTFMAEPWNVPENDPWPLACVYPDTYARIMQMLDAGTMPKNVVIIEHHDLKGRVLGS